MNTTIYMVWQDNVCLNPVGIEWRIPLIKKAIREQRTNKMLDVKPV